VIHRVLFIEFVRDIEAGDAADHSRPATLGVREDLATREDPVWSEAAVRPVDKKLDLRLRRRLDVGEEFLGLARHPWGEPP
jgi:hypothetical protein